MSPSGSPFFLRGAVFVIKFEPDDPDRSGVIKKYVLCLQEGRIVQNRDRFTGVLLTTCKDNSEPKKYAWNIYISPSESKTKFGALIDCSQIHTIPQEDIIEYAYKLEDETMKKVNRALQFGIGAMKIEDLKDQFRNR
jgi:mRNA-degrading endonuclease toxin of MazEF toxin-antitoxin module